MNLRLSIHDSSFKKFLSSSIVVMSFFLNDTVRNRPSVFEHPDVSIHHCLFSSCESDGNGGAICYDTNSGEFKVIRSVFHSNSASANGGGIFFEGTNFLLAQDCFDGCSANNNGQAYSVKSQNGQNPCNDTNIVKCTEQVKHRNGFTTYSQNGGGNFHYNNYSNNNIARGAAAIATLLSEVRLVSYCSMVNNSAFRIIDFTFSIVPVEILRCNLIGNVATVMTVIGYSFTTVFDECYFRDNSKPITSQPSGRPHTITFRNCIYDAFGILNKNGIIFEDCRPIQLQDTMIPIEPRFSKQPCAYYDVVKKNFWDGFDIWFIVMASAVVLIVHSLLIHTDLYADFFRSFFGSPNNHTPSKRRIARGVGTIRLE